MEPLTLAQEIIDGRRITREDELLFFILRLILSWICTKLLTLLWEVAIMSW